MELTNLVFYKQYLKSTFLVGLFFLLYFFGESFCLIQTGKFPYIKRLTNGNYILLSSRNITFADGSLSEVVNTLNFDIDKFSDFDDIYSSLITEFKVEEKGYVLAILKQQLYIFSANGDYIKDIDLSSYISGKYSCSLIPSSYSENNNYIITLIYGEGSSGVDEYCKYFRFKKIIFNPIEKTISISTDISSFSPLNYTKNNQDFKGSFSCEIMEKDGKEYIACFYGNDDNILCSLFDKETYIEKKTIVSNSGCHFIKSLILPSSKENAVFCSTKSDNVIRCNSFNINSESLSDYINIDCQCLKTQSALIIEYFYETNKIIIGCLGENSKYYLSEFSFSSNLVKDTDKQEFNNLGQNIGNVGRINIIVPPNQSKYCALSFTTQSCESSFCETIIKTIDDLEINILYTYPIISESTTLICNEPQYYNYEHTNCIDNIPEGYYCNNTNERTIEKCHNNCRECNEGPSESNHNCISCKDEFYYDFGNCFSESQCNNGVFTDDSIKKCKCRSDNKCLLCNSESINLQLCLGCNTDSEYYKKKDDSNNQGEYVKCYNNDDKGDGFYLNSQNKQYEPCYERCQKCNEFGDVNNNNCLECKSEYIKLKNNNNIENCYDICPKYFYFNNANTYSCVDEDNCPSGYKLINEKKKCVSDCNDDDTYKLEYNNICYQECPIDTKNINSNLCQLKCEDFNKYYSYNREECITEIPSGFYCNDETQKTIEKCHSNCKTCKEGGSDEINNCETCDLYSDKKYFYLGNCLTESQCINGYYTDNSINKCKCIENIKCKTCNKTSIQNDLCESCNDGYYKKKDDSTNIEPYFNCYNHTTIDDGFYLNTETNLFEPCYSSCSKCEELGDINDNKCTVCKEGYSFIANNNNKINCYPNCDNNIYFDNNEYYCTSNESCPNGYKLINGKKRCIDNCINDKIYNYTLEYNNVCVDECPGTSHISTEDENKCIDNLNCNEGEYYNYEYTACITTIPDGYYCNNTLMRTIDKCHENCKTCKEGGNDENNNCETCPSTGKQYFDLGICKEDCVHDFFINETNSMKTCKCSSNDKCFYCTRESNENNLCVSCNYELEYYPKIDEENGIDGFINCYKNPEGYYLDGQHYVKCYSSCKSCNILGNETDNKCIECKSTHEKKNDFENDNNCYLKCQNYYYYDSDNKYKCTTEERCPGEYNKLIGNKRRCIDDCKNDNLYKHEYQNKCYDTCPNGTNPSNNNFFLCVKQEKEKCNEDKPYFIIETQICAETCNITDFLNDKCNTEYQSTKTTQNNIKKFQDAIISGSFVPYLEDGSLIKKDNNTEYEVALLPNNNDNDNANISTIKLGECENKLKSFYKINKNESLLLFKVDIYYEGMLSPIVIYELYYPPEKKRLDLIHCKDVLINISLPAKINEDKLYKYDPSNPFYNDICSTYTTDNGTDISLDDRKNEFINNNMSLCEDGCKYTNYDSRTKKVNCECEIKVTFPLIS